MVMKSLCCGRTLETNLQQTLLQWPRSKQRTLAVSVYTGSGEGDGVGHLQHKHMRGSRFSHDIGTTPPRNALHLPLPSGAHDSR
jgi:hypothetical protein